MTVWLTREVWGKSYTLLGSLWLIPTGSDQATDDGCAVWSASVRRFGFVSGGCGGITTSCKQQSCQCLGRPTSHFLCWSQGAARRTWHTSPLTRAEAATTTTTTTTTVLECKKPLKTWFLQWCDPACGCCLQGSPDLKAAKEVADYLKTKHHEFTFTVQVQNSWADQWVILSSSSSSSTAAAADSAQAQPEVLCKVDWSSRMNSSQVYIPMMMGLLLNTSTLVGFAIGWIGCDLRCDLLHWDLRCDHHPSKHTHVLDDTQDQSIGCEDGVVWWRLWWNLWWISLLPQST